LTNQTPASFEQSKPSAQLLIFLGLTCISFFLLFCVLMVLQQLGVINLSVLNSTDTFDDPDVLKLLKIVQIASEIFLFILPVIVFVFMAARKRAEYLQINRVGKISVLLLGGFVMIIASPLINFLAEINAHLQLPEWLHGLEIWMKDSETKDDALTSAFLDHQNFYDLIVNLIMIALVAAVSEELFFRGILQKILIKITKNTQAGIWITGAVFSAIHVQFYGFLPRMLMGVYLGYLLVWSGSIWVPIFAHFINNGLAVLFAFLEERKIISDAADKVGSQGSEAWYVVISTALVVLFLMAIYKLSGRKDMAITG
jgi:uncharacterized protein